MKHIQIVFEDKEYEKLLKIKSKKSWREFILEKCLEEEKW